MISEYIPPPQNVPAEIQTIDAPHRLESPEQSVINDVNQGKYGNGFTASQDLNKSVEGIAEGVAGAKEAKDRAEENEEQSNATKGPGHADYTDPPAFEQKETPTQEANAPSESRGESADSSPSNDNGYDYYNGIG